MKILAIDVETFFDKNNISKLPPVEPDSRLKDPKKIKQNIEEKTQKMIETASLNPLYSKLACIGYYGDEIKEVHLADEKEMIEKLVELMKQDNIFISWNGTAFDWDFIIKRGIILGIEDLNLKHLEVIRSRKNPQFIDLMEKWCGYGKFAKLDEVASILLNEHKEEFDVKEIPNLIKTKTGKELIKRYCLKDCILLYEIAKKCGY